MFLFKFVGSANRCLRFQYSLSSRGSGRVQVEKSDGTIIWSDRSTPAGYTEAVINLTGMDSSSYVSFCTPD